MKRLHAVINCKYLHFKKVNKTRSDGISSTKAKILGWASAGTALVAGGAAVVLTGPFGLGALALSAIATGGVVGGAGLGAGITSSITSILPKNLFRDESIEIAVEAEESVGTVATVSAFDTVSGVSGD